MLGIVFQYLKQLADGDPLSLELYSNTLQAIAVGYLVTSLALLHLRVRRPDRLAGRADRGLLGLARLRSIWGASGGNAGTNGQSSPVTSMMKVLDVFRRDHSFTWIVTSLGFSASVLLGAMAGHLLRARLAVPRRLLYLVLLGLACLAGGWIWSYSLP